MKKLIKDLQENNMIKKDEWCFSFTTVPTGGGAIGGLIEGLNTWYCCLSTECFYVFKIKNVFSYKGIKWDTVKKINLKEITRINLSRAKWGTFGIFYGKEKVSGALEYGGKEILMEMLKFLEENSQIEITIS